MTAKTDSTAFEDENYSDDEIRAILASVKTVAMVGASSNKVRPSYFAYKYLLAKGYDVHAVNPGIAGEKLLGREVYASLGDVPGPIDMVDIFRNSEAAGAITDEAIALRAKVVWMQLGVSNPAAAARARKAGLSVIMNRCPKIEYGRLSGEIAWAGVNPRRISSKKPTRMKGFQHLGIVPKD